MNKKSEERIRDLLFQDKIMPEDIPDIGLYMDQVTTFMNNKFSSVKRNPEDKIMTKTMINNYSKNHLLPPSDRKKYSREHVMLIIMIYYLKSILSMADIQTVIEPLTTTFFHEGNEKGICLEDIYRNIIETDDERKEATISQLMEIADVVSDARDKVTSPALTDKDQRYLDELFAICALGYDIYIRKRMIEQLIDNFREDYPPERKKKKKPSK